MLYCQYKQLTVYIIYNNTKNEELSNESIYYKSIQMKWGDKMMCLYTCISGLLTYFLGEYDGLLMSLLVFVVVNYISNVIYMVVKHKNKREVGIYGVCKKILIFLLVGVANIIDVEIIGTSNVMRTSAISFYLATEGLSLLKSSAKLGVPVPSKLRVILEQLIEGESNIEE